MENGLTMRCTDISILSRSISQFTAVLMTGTWLLFNVEVPPLVRSFSLSMVGLVRRRLSLLEGHVQYFGRRLGRWDFGIHKKAYGVTHRNRKGVVAFALLD